MAGTVTQAITTEVDHIKVATFTATADASDGSFPATTLTVLPRNGIGGRLLQMITDPDGTTAPQDNWDVVLTNGGGDMLLGGGANRDTANTEVAVLESNGAHPIYAGTDSLILTITGNNVNSAGIVIKLYFAEGI